MSLSLTQVATACSPNLSVSFLAIGGTSPYVYSVRPSGSGGIIDPVTGVYTAPAQVAVDPLMTSDVIQVRDSLGAIATASILVGTPVMLFCDILQNQLGLDANHVFLWDQKIFKPVDFGLYIVVSVPLCKPFGNNKTYSSSGNSDPLISNQYINMMATVDMDIISRGPAARDQKEQVVMALQSDYSERQQEANSFQISKLPVGSHFVNISEIDGAAIPYRYKISLGMQYTTLRTMQVPYFDVFATTQVTTNS